MTITTADLTDHPLLLEGENVTGKPLAIAVVLVACAAAAGLDRPWSMVHELAGERRAHPLAHRSR